MRAATPRRFVFAIFLALAAVACSRGASNGVPLEKPPIPQVSEERRAVIETEGWDLEAFQEANALSFGDVDYTPSAAHGIDTIQDSELALNDAELAMLDENGFVISDRLSFMSFGTGFEQIYKNDLPVFISADAMMHVVHRSYDAILMDVERTHLSPRLVELLRGMHESLATGHPADLDATTRADVDFYLTVARSLLESEAVSPVAGADAGQVQEMVAVLLRASGPYDMRFFGDDRKIDASQFTLRGHYLNDPQLQRYFRAMMWLGRIDLRLVETRDDGTRVVQRPQLLAAYALRSLMDDERFASWERIDATIGAFVGEHDSMPPSQLEALFTELGAKDVAGLNAIPDAQILEAIDTHAFGHQRISSHLAVSKSSDTLKTNASFLLLGQRYVIDSHVFSNVVYDRVLPEGLPPRMMPEPLDAAYAVFGNDHAASILAPELERYGYAENLQAIRALADGHSGEFWNGNLYNLWLSALRTLSPQPGQVKEPRAYGMPEVAGTEAWARRILNTQLASWAELRHDTLLYAKQSYTMGILCEFPDAYVEPYPEFFAALAAYAEEGRRVLSSLQGNGSRVAQHFDHLAYVSNMLEEMASFQRDGKPFSDDHMAFINNAVRIKAESVGCATEYQPLGWYPELFYDVDDSIEYDPTIADVHTQNTDEVGNVVGRILHVGTGQPRLMIMTADTCEGPRAYAGLVSSYHEVITENFERLNDESWAAKLQQEKPADPTWLEPVIAR